MITSIIISVLTCLCLILSVLFFPKLKIKNIEINTYWLVCIIGAILMILFNTISFNEVTKGLLEDSSINPIKIVILFISMTFLSIFLDEIGLFHYLAGVAASKSKTSQTMLFIILYLLVSILTMFTSNDIVILTFTPFICYFSKKTKINPIPYLVAEFAAANTWSMALMIGNPTNIYLSLSSNIDFISYIKVMWLPTLLAGITESLLIFLIFRKDLSKPLNFEIEEEKIQDKFGLVIGIIHLLICLVLLTVSSYINLEMWIVCVCCMTSLILWIVIIRIIKKENNHYFIKTTKRLPFDLIPFVLSMFIIVLSLNKNGVTNEISKLLGESDTILKYGFTSFLASNLINNIPMSVLFSNIPNMSSSIDNLRAIYSSIIGSNIGAFLTPIGALAGIMFSDLVNKQKVNYGFSKFIKYGIIISIPTILSALLGLMITLH